MIPGEFVVYLAVGRVDLRGAVDRLSAVAAEVLKMDPGSGALFLFLNARRNRLKALWWDSNGYAILYKRLQRGSFKIPEVMDCPNPYIELSSAEFGRILAGLAWQPDKRDWVH